jgi:glycosyltransferase involved in cell wall biosynthesis
MPTSPPLIVNVAYGAQPNSFFEPHLGDVTRWRHFEAGEPFRSTLLTRVRSSRLRRYRACYLAARCAAREGAAVVVSHDPQVSFVTELFLRRFGYRGKHLAFSFNYPKLPTGLTRKVHGGAYRTVDRFVVYSTMERELYGRYFGIPLEKLQMIHWAVNPPPVEPDMPVVDGDYVCAIGGNGRDYATLVEAARRLPKVHFVLVVRPHSLNGLDVPQNVTVATNIPLARAMNLLKFARFMALPLTGADVPCGHVTLVHAMHLGKAMAVTRSSGVSDYVREGENALTCAAGSVEELTAIIRRLWDDATLRERLGANGRSMAQACCSEARTLAYFRGVLVEWGVIH